MTRQYHIKLNGTGFMLQEAGGRVTGYRESTQNALSIKTAQGDPKYSDQSHLSSYVQTDWRGGRAENRAEAGNRFADGRAGTWIKEHLVARPAQRIAGRYDPSDAWTGSYARMGTNHADNTWPQLAWLAAGAETRKVGFQIDSASGGSVSAVTLLMSLEDGQVGPGTGTLTVRIETNSGAAPSGTLVHANATGTFAISNLTPLWAWCRVTFAGSFSIADNNWIVISASGHASDGEPRIAYGSFVSNTNSAITKFYDGASWDAGSTAERPFYFFEDIEKFASTPTVGINFNANYYIGAGTQLYKWVNASREWDAVGSAFSTAITDLDVLDNVLWICVGKGNNIWTMNTSEAFTEKTGITGQILHTYNGYLYRANANQLFYTSDGTAWTSTDAEGGTFLFGSNQYDITGIAGLNGAVLIAKPDGLWEFASGDFVVGVERWETQIDANNGTGMVEWNGAVYIPVKQGLVKYDLKSFDADVGPDRDEGLPADRIGKIVSIVPLLNYLLVAVDATGASQYGSVLLYNGYGWHELGRAWRAGERVRMVGYDVTNSLVHYSMGGHMATLAFSDTSDNIISYDPGYVEWTGAVETSWISGGLLDSWKLLSTLWVNFETDGTKERVLVDYRVDRNTGVWRHLGALDTESGAELDFKTADGIGTPGTVASINSTTGAVTLTDIGGIVAGKFVRIGYETRQALSINSNTFTPVAPYENAAVGDTPTGGYPTCREVQLRIRYSASGTNSPRIRAVRLNWANQLTRWRRWQLNIRCESNMQLLDGTQETRTAAQIYTDLDELLQGSTVLVLSDLDEVSRTVQVVNAQVSEPEIVYTVPGGAFTAQRMVVLDVVEI